MIPTPFETSFARALLDPQAPMPFGVGTENNATPVRRFAVHRNNVVAGLIGTLRARFPAVEKIVGEEFFAAMARVFVTATPPRTPVLTTYGDEFADFIAAFEPARELAYLADVARLEAARTRAYHAADAVPIDTNRFAALDPDAVSDIRVNLHPSAEIVRSRHPIVTIWAMNSSELELGAHRGLARRGCARGPPAFRRGSASAATGRRCVPARARRRTYDRSSSRGGVCRTSGI